MQKGDVFSTSKLRKGFEDLRKLYGGFGYIDFVSEPDIEPVPGTDKVDLTLNFDEGKQFFVRRIDFSGNTTTRDRVIRRELLIDEGDVYNTRLWQLSILRLNQLGYFDPLKEEDAADIKRDNKTSTVDLTLKVKERGKNSVQLNGGVSGIAGSFLGASYATNNLLGLGETFDLSTTMGTRTRSGQLGFTEPYFLGRPMQLGGTVFIQRFDYNQAREASILSGQNLQAYYDQLGPQNALNYVNNSYGFTVFASYPLRRSFARLGLSYGYTIQSIRTLTDAATALFTYQNFLNINGPNALNGITSSTLIPSFTYNTVNHPIIPTAGKALSLSLQFSGGPMGGNVNQIEPVVDAKYFRRGLMARHVIGMHFNGRFVTGYGGKTAPPFNRFYMGGENDVRGFCIWCISPIVFVPTDTASSGGNHLSERRRRKSMSLATRPLAPTVPNDLEAFWMPFTRQPPVQEAPAPDRRAPRACTTTRPTAAPILDGIAGLWCCNAGHCREPIVEAIQKQAAELDYRAAVPDRPSARRSSWPAASPRSRPAISTTSSSATPARKRSTPRSRSRSPITACAAKASRTRLIGRERGYHGVGFGGISVGGIVANRKMFGTHAGRRRSPAAHLQSRRSRPSPRGEPEWGAHLADELERIVALHDASTIAAVIVEPMAGSTGVLPPPKGYLERLREICDKHGILLIFDEVITGFGRLGTRVRRRALRRRSPT